MNDVRRLLGEEEEDAASNMPDACGLIGDKDVGKGAEMFNLRMLFLSRAFESLVWISPPPPPSLSVGWLVSSWFWRIEWSRVDRA